MHPQVSIVIPSWNGAKLLGPCLEGLFSQEGIDFEILVVDHGKQNRETQILIDQLASPLVCYLPEERQLGYAGAVNYGVERARAPLVAVICNDIIVEKNWLAALLQAHGEEKNRGRSPILFSWVEKLEVLEPTAARMNLWFRVVHPPSWLRTKKFFHPDGNAFLFERSRYGLPFDADYFLYQEDVYLGWRSQLMGEDSLLVTESRAKNFDGGTTRRTPYLTSFYSERNRWMNYLIFLSPLNLLKCLPLLAFDSFVKLIFGSNFLAKINAYGWILWNFPVLVRKRMEIQKNRKVDDDQILPLLSSTYIEGKEPINRLIRFFVRSILRLPLGP